MKKTIFTLLAIGTILLSGCSSPANNNNVNNSPNGIKQNQETSSSLKESKNGNENSEINLNEAKISEIKESTSTNESAINERYYNEEMGVSFSYNPKEYIIKESQGLIEIGFIEDSTFTNTTEIKLFNKEINQSIKDAITDKFLNNDINKNCVIVEKKFNILPVQSMERYGIFPKVNDGYYEVNDGYYDFREGCGIKDGWRNDILIIYNPLFSHEKFLVVDPSMDHYGFLEQIEMDKKYTRFN